MANHIRSIRGQWKDPAAVDTRTSHHNTDEKQVDRNIDRTNPLQHGTATTRLSHMGRFLAWTLFAYGRARVQALCVACEEGDTAKAAKLLATGVYVDGRDDQQITPLVWAIRHRHWEIVKLLLSYHANPNCSAPMTPLLEAVSSKRMDIVEVLVKNGAVVNAKDLSNERFRGITALHRAVELDLQDIVYFLLSQGADCKLTYCDHTADLHNISPLHIAKGRCAHHIKTSTERDYDWFRASAKDSQGRIPLFWALERNDWEAVASCLPHHSTAKDSIDVHGNSALHLLCDILSSSHLPRDLIWVTSLVLSVDREVIRRPNNAGKFPLQMLAASAANRSQHQRSDDESVFKACKDDILATDLASQHRIRHPEDYMDSYITYCFGTAPTPTKEELEERHCKWELQQAHEAQTLAEQTAYFSSLMEQQKDDSERQNNKSEKEQRHII
ncbi:ankyrin repeat-containing domain protein [Xylariales sp. PMI_506]|nr:ankyrin repeat-containing domain protein [Xylariales sp. PMI_506]